VQVPDAHAKPRNGFRLDEQSSSSSTIGRETNMYIHYRKVGGLAFLTIGRINLSWSVTSHGNWVRKIEDRMDAETIRALVSIL